MLNIMLKHYFNKWVKKVENNAIIEQLKYPECNTFTAVPADALESEEAFSEWCKIQRK